MYRHIHLLNMKIICAGLQKTGTKSMAQALRRLGYVVYDFQEHWQYHINEYDQAFSTGKTPDFASMYSNVDAVVDIPACLFWKELKETFPDAKVVLMERDSADVWVKSCLETRNIARETESKPHNLLGLLLTPTGRKYRRVLIQGIRNKGTASLLPNKDLGKSYLEHNARVKASIPRDELLVYNVKQGWEPLCDFLGVDVPDKPFPRLNTKSDMIVEMLKSSIFDKVHNEMIVCGVILAVMLAALVYFFVY